jgi:predicted small lipoprotein YifL
MKSKIILLITIMMLTFTMTGCGGSGSGEASDQSRSDATQQEEMVDDAYGACDQASRKEWEKKIINIAVMFVFACMGQITQRTRQ